ncbi:UBP-type zinc finger domain-containing protein [Streptomyces sp. MUM 136J]|uniref:UBP-type zinc finger domain-containing protein n=1 Tax=Streptomyces sp. MUM 136J TaxID=2791992 RepID=UPI0035AB6E05|nr:UBP-type zinc finger domain-containing protein [Streptomyces sp. MUM 136J]
MEGGTRRWTARGPRLRACRRDRSAPEAGEPLCRECARRGWAWVGLRLCLTCGHLGCCDSSRGAHATAHHESTGHPVARCLGTGCARPGRGWAWCHADEVYLWPR